MPNLFSAAPDAAARRAARAPRLAKWFVLSALLLAAAALLGTGIALQGTDGAVVRLDADINAWMHALRAPRANVVALDLTALGSSTLVTLLTVVCGVLFALLGDWRAVAHLAVASAGAGLWSRGLKHLFERARPDEAIRLAEASGFSYPSGHALLSTALYLTFAVLACRVFRTVHERVVIFSLAAVVIGLIGATRIYLGVHYASDVLGGMAVGAAWACLLAGLIGYPRASDDPGTPR